MAILPDTVLGGPLLTGQEPPGVFWKLLDNRITMADWQEASQRSFHCLEGLPISLKSGNINEITSAILREAQFGSDHWQLNPFKRLYYSYFRPILPVWVRLEMKHLLKNYLTSHARLDWPIEDRYVRFLWETMFHLLEQKGLESVPYIHFWPQGKRFSFVLTHDVESASGQAFVRQVADLEESYGFHSSFNFVPEEYAVDRSLIESLQARGFEVGVHGIKHDGKLFYSKNIFLKIASEINRYLTEWGAVGFRAPLTLRNPEWMQTLEIEYDSSFFDTDPFEPIPGGTMSIWPFQMGRFIELPYTLVQDHSLMVTLREKTPRIWLEKVDFIRRYCGMALVISHPDYLKHANHLSIYEDFLRQMRHQEDFWQALPKDVEQWWKQRSIFDTANQLPANQAKLSGRSIGEIRRVGSKIELII